MFLRCVFYLVFSTEVSRGKLQKRIWQSLFSVWYKLFSHPCSWLNNRWGKKGFARIIFKFQKLFIFSFSVTLLPLWKRCAMLMPGSRVFLFFFIYSYFLHFTLFQSLLSWMSNIEKLSWQILLFFSPPVKTTKKYMVGISLS